MALAGGGELKLVIADNDFNGPPNTLSNLRAALMFLESPEVRVLGLTVVTGDGWRDEEVAHTLRLLEIAGLTEFPVVPGASFPWLTPSWKPRLGLGKAVWIARIQRRSRSPGRLPVS